MNILFILSFVLFSTSSYGTSYQSVASCEDNNPSTKNVKIRILVDQKMEDGKVMKALIVSDGSIPNAEKMGISYSLMVADSASLVLNSEAKSMTLTMDKKSFLGERGFKSVILVEGENAKFVGGYGKSFNCRIDSPEQKTNSKACKISSDREHQDYMSENQFLMWGSDFVADIERNPSVLISKNETSWKIKCGEKKYRCHVGRSYAECIIR